MQGIQRQKSVNCDSPGGPSCLGAKPSYLMFSATKIHCLKPDPPGRVAGALCQHWDVSGTSSSGNNSPCFSALANSDGLWLLLKTTQGPELDVGIQTLCPVSHRSPHHPWPMPSYLLWGKGALRLCGQEPKRSLRKAKERQVSKSFYFKSQSDQLKSACRVSQKPRRGCRVTRKQRGAGASYS